MTSYTNPNTGDAYFTSGSNSAMVINNLGNVGIGSTLPYGVKLDVNGAMFVRNQTTNHYHGGGAPSPSPVTFAIAFGGSVPGDTGTGRGWAINYDINYLNFTVGGGGGYYTAMRFEPDGIRSYGYIVKASGTFDIEHPTNPQKRLVHSFIEGPRCDLIYRGEVQLENGTAIINIDAKCTHDPECAMSEGTFVALCANPTVYLQNKTTFDNLRYEITGNILTIICQNNESNAIVSWMVVAERKDAFIKKWNMTNESGFLVTEYAVDSQ